MADLLPSIPDADGPASDDPRVIGLDSDDASDLISALSSETARQVLAVLHEEPTTPSVIADRVDTSLQNVQYHLGNLEDAAVVEVVDTAYSEKGREMKVYAPANRALVVVAGREDETPGLKSALSSLLGGVGVLGLASVVVDRLVRRPGFGAPLRTDGEGADGAPDADAGAGPTSDTAAEGGQSGGGGSAGGDGGVGGDGGSGGGGTGGETATPTDVATAGDRLPDGNATAGTTTTDQGGFEIADATTTATGTRPPTGTTAAESVTATGMPTPTPAATGTPSPTAVPTEAVSTSTPPPTPAPTPTPTPVPEATLTATRAARTAADAADPIVTVAGFSPGVLFFLGGLAVLLGWFVLTVVRTRR